MSLFGSMSSTPPPIRKRNPAITIRRVQSERKCFNTWRGCPPSQPPPLPPPLPPRQFLRTHHEYAPRTAIIPSHMGVPPLRVIPTGRMWHHSPIVAPSQAMMQPLMLAAPPLIISAGAHHPYGYPGGLREEDILARDRLETFFNSGGGISPHKPRSLLSYPDSHVYESLISQLSEMADEDISITKPTQQLDETKLAIQAHDLPLKQDEPKPETSIDCRTTQQSDRTAPKSSPNEVCSSCNKLKSASKRNNMLKKSPSLVKVANETHTNQIHSKFALKSSSSPDIASRFKASENVVPILADLSQLISHLEGNKPLNGSSIKNENDSQDSPDTNSKVSAYQKLKALLKSKLRSGNQNIYEEITPTPTAVSVVHINKDSGDDEVTVRASVCYKCDGTIRRKDFIGDDNYLATKNPLKKDKIPNSKMATTHKSSFRNERSVANTRIAMENTPVAYQRQPPFVPKTVVLPEMGLSSANLGKNSIKNISSKNDKAIQVNPQNIPSERSAHMDSSTLDPLRPSFKFANNQKHLKRNKTFSSRRNSDSFDSFEKKFPQFFSIKEYKKENIRKDVQQITLDFDSEDSYSYDEEDSNDSWNFEGDSSSLYSSIVEANPQLCLEDLNSLVLVYNATRNPKILVPSKYKSATPVPVPRGGSSGLGSSGSYSSFEDLPSSGLGSSSVSFIEPSFRSSTLTIGSKGSLRFDYSKSWDHLNEGSILQKKTSRETQSSPTTSPIKKSALLSIKSALPWSLSRETRNASKT